MQRLALTGACLGLLAALGACSGEVTASDSGTAQQKGDIRVLDEDEPDDSRNPTANRRGPLSDGGAASCVESYAPEAVTGRAFAFDGVVVEVGPSVSDRGDEADLGLPGVTFEVREWFSGGRADTVTVDMQTPTTGSANPSDPEYAYVIGSRLLVSGEARWGGSPLEYPIAWGCGFSRYYDPETAAAWHAALAP
jgi:hypothetical protein